MSQLEEATVLEALTHDVRNFATMLRGLSFATRAIMSIHKAGLKIIAQDSRILLGEAYIPMNTFEEFTFVPESTSRASQVNGSQSSTAFECSEFEFPLDAMLECLNIFGSGMPVQSTTTHPRKRWERDGDNSDDDANQGRKVTGRTVDLNTDGGTRLDQFFTNVSGDTRKTIMRMRYAGAGHPLEVVLIEDKAGPTTNCEITTYEPEAPPDLPFDDLNKLLWIILPSALLRDALSEFDASCENLTIITEPNRYDGTGGRLLLQTSGTYGASEVEYPSEPHVLETFDCQKPIRFIYRLSHINRALRAMQASSRASLRIDAEGLLSLQFMMNTTEGAYVEFAFVSLEEDS